MDKTHRRTFIILLLTYILKVLYFSLATDIPMSKLVYGIVTISIFTSLYMITYKKTKLYMLISSVVTIIMFGDILYYRYFMDYLSLKLLNQATFLGSVTDIVLSIIKVSDVILFVDLIVFYVYRNKIANGRLFSKRYAFLTSLILMPTIVIGISSSQVYTGIKEYEFFNYHMYDIIAADFENSNLTSSDRQEIIGAMVERQTEIANADYFGIGKDMNLLVIQLESFQNDFIGKEYEGQEILPNLNALIEDNSFYFKHYYQQLGKGNTSDAEFATLNSLYPVLSGNTYNLYEKNRFMGLPWILREHGYNASSYHGYISTFWNRENIYPHEGFEKSHFEDDYVMGEKIVFGLDDYDFFMQSLPMLENRPDKQFDFMVTLSSHKPFTLPEDKQLMTLHGNEDAFFEDYIQSIHYTDHVLGEFIEGLKAAGLFENTVIAIYGDHFGIGIENQDAFDSMTRFLERSYTMEDMLNIPLIIRVPGMETSETIETTGGQVDFLPTILNIMGIENEYVTFGRDLLNEQQGFMASQTFMGPGSFIMGDIVYESSKDEVFENGTAYRRDTLEPVELEGLEPYYNFALNQLQLSKRVTETDAVHELLLSYKEYRYGVIDKE